MVNNKIITPQETVLRVTYKDLQALLHRQVRPPELYQPLISGLNVHRVPLRALQPQETWRCRNHNLPQTLRTHAGGLMLSGDTQWRSQVAHLNGVQVAFPTTRPKGHPGGGGNQA